MRIYLFFTTIFKNKVFGLLMDHPYFGMIHPFHLKQAKEQNKEVTQLICSRLTSRSTRTQPWVAAIML